ncbi:MAG: hypothetical protein DWQ10_11230 [Calditrichaeota bacterium]|nr:MAG: hypothetical protein DWQ10_11230 [Calditrichota bacterium]
MKKTNIAGPAFPSRGEKTEYKGMTLRDYFAAHALQGLLANGHKPNEWTAEEAFTLADYMLDKRLEEKKKS